MENLKSRILIKHKEGATIAYLYNRESFDLLKIKKDTYDQSQFIKINQTIEYNGKKYKVCEINIKMENSLIEVEHGYGINLDSPTKPSNYNCQIGIFVDDIQN